MEKIKEEQIIAKAELMNDFEYVRFDIQNLIKELEEEEKLISELIVEKKELEALKEINDAILIERKNLRMEELVDYESLLNNFLKYCSSLVPLQNEVECNIYKKQLNFVKQIAKKVKLIYFAEERVKNLKEVLFEYQKLARDYSEISLNNPLKKDVEDFSQEVVLAWNTAEKENSEHLNSVNLDIENLEAHIESLDINISKLSDALKDLGVIEYDAALNIDSEKTKFEVLKNKLQKELLLASEKTQFEILKNKLQKELLLSYLKEFYEAKRYYERTKELHDMLKHSMKMKELCEKDTMLRKQLKLSKGTSEEEKLLKELQNLNEERKKWFDNEPSVQEAVLLTRKKIVESYSIWALKKVNLDKIDVKLSNLQAIERYLSSLDVSINTEQNITIEAIQSIESNVIRKARDLNLATGSEVNSLIKPNFTESELCGLYKIWHSKDKLHKHRTLQKIQESILQKEAEGRKLKVEIVGIEALITSNEILIKEQAESLNDEHLKVLEKLITAVELTKVKLKDCYSSNAVLEAEISGIVKKIENALLIQAILRQDAISKSGDLNIEVRELRSHIEISELQSQLEIVEEKKRKIKQKEEQLLKEIDLYEKAYIKVDDVDLPGQLFKNWKIPEGEIEKSINKEPDLEIDNYQLEIEKTVTIYNSILARIHIGEVLLGNLLQKMPSLPDVDDITYDIENENFQLEEYQDRLNSIGINDDVLEMFGEIGHKISKIDVIEHVPEVEQQFIKRSVLSQKLQKIHSEEAKNTLKEVYGAIKKIPDIAFPIVQLTRSLMNTLYSISHAKESLELSKRKQSYLDNDKQFYLARLTDKNSAAKLKNAVEEKLKSIKILKKGTRDKEALEKLTLEFYIYSEVNAELDINYSQEDFKEKLLNEINKAESNITEFEQQKEKLLLQLKSIKNDIEGLRQKLLPFEIEMQEIEKFLKMLRKVEELYNVVIQENKKSYLYNITISKVVENIILEAVTPQEEENNKSELLKIKKEKEDITNCRKKEMEALNTLRYELVGKEVAGLEDELEAKQQLLKEEKTWFLQEENNFNNLRQKKNDAQLILGKIKNENKEVKNISDIVRQSIEKQEQEIRLIDEMLSTKIEYLEKKKASILLEERAIDVLRNKIVMAKELIQNRDPWEIVRPALELKEKLIRQSIDETNAFIIQTQQVIIQERIVLLSSDIKAVSEAVSEALKNKQNIAKNDDLLELKPFGALSDDYMSHILRKMEEVEQNIESESEDEGENEHPLHMSQKYASDVERLKLFIHEEATTVTSLIPAPKVKYPMCIEEKYVANDEVNLRMDYKKWTAKYEHASSVNKDIPIFEKKMSLEQHISQLIQDVDSISKNIMDCRAILVLLRLKKTDIVLEKQEYETSLMLQSLMQKQFELSNDIRKSYDELHLIDMHSTRVIKGREAYVGKEQLAPVALKEISVVKQHLHEVRKNRMHCSNEIEKLDHAIKIARYDFGFLKDQEGYYERLAMLKMIEYNRADMVKELKVNEYKIDLLWLELVKLRNIDGKDDTIPNKERDFEIQERIREIEQWEFDATSISGRAAMLDQNGEKYKAMQSIITNMKNREHIAAKTSLLVPYSDIYKALDNFRKSKPDMILHAETGIVKLQNQQNVKAMKHEELASQYVGVRMHDLTVWKLLNNLLTLLTHPSKGSVQSWEIGKMLQKLRDIKIEHETEFNLPEYYDSYIEVIQAMGAFKNGRTIEQICSEQNAFLDEIRKLEKEKQLRMAKRSEKEKQIKKSLDRNEVEILTVEIKESQSLDEKAALQILEKKQKCAQLDEERINYYTELSSWGWELRTVSRFMKAMKLNVIFEEIIKERDEINIYFSKILNINNDPQIVALFKLKEKKKESSIYYYEAIQKLNDVLMNAIVDGEFKWKKNVLPILKNFQKDSEESIAVIKLQQMKSKVAYKKAVEICKELKNTLAAKFEEDGEKVLLEKFMALKFPANDEYNYDEVNCYLKAVEALVRVDWKIEPVQPYIYGMREVLKKIDSNDIAYEDAILKCRETRNDLIETLHLATLINEKLSEKLKMLSFDSIENSNNQKIGSYLTKIITLLKSNGHEIDLIQKEKDSITNVLGELNNPRIEQTSDEYQKILGSYEKSKSDILENVKADILHNNMLLQQLEVVDIEALEAPNYEAARKYLREVIALMAEKKDEEFNWLVGQQQMNAILKQFQNEKGDVDHVAYKEAVKKHEEAIVSYKELKANVIKNIQESNKANDLLLVKLDKLFNKEVKDFAMLRTNLVQITLLLKESNRLTGLQNQITNMERELKYSTIPKKEEEYKKTVKLYHDVKSKILARLQMDNQNNKKVSEQLKEWDLKQQESLTDSLGKIIILLENKDQKMEFVKKKKSEALKFLKKLHSSNKVNVAYENILSFYEQAMSDIRKTFNEVKKRTQKEEIMRLEQMDKNNYYKAIWGLIDQYLYSEMKEQKQQIALKQKEFEGEWKSFPNSRIKAIKGMEKIAKVRQDIEEFLVNEPHYRQMPSIRSAFDRLQNLKEKHKREEMEEMIYRRWLDEQGAYLSEFSTFLHNFLDSKVIYLKEGSTEYSSYITKLLLLLNNERSKNLIEKLPQSIKNVVPYLEAKLKQMERISKHENLNKATNERYEYVEEEKRKMFILYKSALKFLEAEQREYNKKRENLSSEGVIREIFRHREMENVWNELEIAISFELTPEDMKMQIDYYHTQILTYLSEVSKTSHVAGNDKIYTVLKMIEKFRELNGDTYDKEVLLKKNKLQQVIIKELQFFSDILAREESLMQLERQREDLWRYSNNNDIQKLWRERSFLNKQLIDAKKELEGEYKISRANKVKNLAQLAEAHLSDMLYSQKEKINSEIASLQLQLKSLLRGFHVNSSDSFKNMKMEQLFQNSIAFRSDVLKEKLKKMISSLGACVALVESTAGNLSKNEKRSTLCSEMKNLNDAAKKELQNVGSMEKIALKNADDAKVEIMLSGKEMLRIELAVTEIYQQLTNLESDNVVVLSEKLETVNLEKSDTLLQIKNAIEKTANGKNFEKAMQKIGKCNVSIAHHNSEIVKISLERDEIEEKLAQLEEQKLKLLILCSEEKKILDNEVRINNATNGYYQKLRQLEELVDLMKEIKSDKKKIEEINIRYSLLNEAMIRTEGENLEMENLKKQKIEMESVLATNEELLSKLQEMSGSTIREIKKEILKRNGSILYDEFTKQASDNLEKVQKSIFSLQKKYQNTADDLIQEGLMIEQYYEQLLPELIDQCFKKLGIKNAIPTNIVNASQQKYAQYDKNIGEVTLAISVLRDKHTVVMRAISENKKELLNLEDQIDIANQEIDELYIKYQEENGILEEMVQELAPHYILLEEYRRSEKDLIKEHQAHEYYIGKLEREKKVLSEEAEKKKMLEELKKLTAVEVLYGMYKKEFITREEYLRKEENFFTNTTLLQKHREMLQEDNNTLDLYNKKLVKINQTIENLFQDRQHIEEKILTLSKVLSGNTEQLNQKGMLRLYELFKEVENAYVLVDEYSARKSFSRRLNAHDKDSARAQHLYNENPVKNAEKIQSYLQSSVIKQNKFQSDSKLYERKEEKLQANIADMIREMEVSYTTNSSILFQNRDLKILIEARSNLMKLQLQKKELERQNDILSISNKIKTIQLEVVLKINNLAEAEVFEDPKLVKLQEQLALIQDDEAKSLSIQEEIIELKLEAALNKVGIISNSDIIASLYFSLLENFLKESGLRIYDEDRSKEEYARYSKMIANLDQEIEILKKNAFIIDGERRSIENNLDVRKRIISSLKLETDSSQKEMYNITIKALNPLRASILKYKASEFSGVEKRITPHIKKLYEEISKKMEEMENAFKTHEVIESEKSPNKANELTRQIGEIAKHEEEIIYFEKKVKALEVEKQRFQQKSDKLKEKAAVYENVARCLSLYEQYIEGNEEKKEYFLAAINSDYLKENSILYGNSQIRKALEKITLSRSFVKTTKILLLAISSENITYNKLCEKFEAIVKFKEHITQQITSLKVNIEDDILFCQQRFEILKGKRDLQKEDWADIQRKLKSAVKSIRESFRMHENSLLSQLSDVIYQELGENEIPKNIEGYEILKQKSMVYDSKIKNLAKTITTFSSEISKRVMINQEIAIEVESLKVACKDKEAEALLKQGKDDIALKDASAFINKAREEFREKYEILMMAAVKYLESFKELAQDSLGNPIELKYSLEEQNERAQKLNDFESALRNFSDSTAYAEKLLSVGKQKIAFDTINMKIEKLENQLHTIGRESDMKSLINLGLKYEEADALYADESPELVEFFSKTSLPEEIRTIFESLKNARINYWQKIEQMQLQYDREVTSIDKNIENLKANLNNHIQEEDARLYTEMQQMLLRNKRSAKEMNYNEDAIFSVNTFSHEQDEYFDGDELQKSFQNKEIFSLNYEKPVDSDVNDESIEYQTVVEEGKEEPWYDAVV
ncbi:hypothetical protein [Candidatus Fokinia crypta]|uniref:Uncharacterized protein n=1 Tax=Candidatus Fokinia crypta TaxID=1920990 RepID=A0ABZ0UPX8_9RICK|nr:hypothetical protein [Candidatus Fokinia cryptica]WPX98166.1 hypothetical protein Fokcrypt_00707 [Candidatus Fokinia cryptica]